jgi:hypothetical protein
VSSSLAARLGGPQPPAATPRTRSMTWLWAIGGVAVLVLGVGVVLYGGTSDDRLSGSCGIVMDGSGTGAPGTGMDTPGIAAKIVEPFLYSTKCRYVAFAPIDGASRTSVCRGETVDLDPDTLHEGHADIPNGRRDMRDSAQRKVQEIYNCIAKDPRSVHASDVLGGLWVIASNRPVDTGKYTVLVISDFAQADKNVSVYSSDLSTPASRTALEDRLVKADLIPDMTGIDVQYAGYGQMVDKDPAKVAGFDAFWQEVMIGRAHCASFKKYVGSGDGDAVPASGK